MGTVVTVTRLRSEGSHGDQDSSFDTLALVSVTAAIASVIGLRVKPLQNASAVLSAEVAVTETLLPVGATESVTIAGSSAPQLRNQIFDRIAQINESVLTQYDDLRKELQLLEDEVSDAWRTGKLFPKEAQIAGGLDPDEFYHTSSGRNG